MSFEISIVVDFVLFLENMIYVVFYILYTYIFLNIYIDLRFNTYISIPGNPNIKKKNSFLVFLRSILVIVSCEVLKIFRGTG